mmetsp:Transcript_23129/g.87528  ORF Transcript_23129/g.87528 Transcript_23129/m.87528 type:complete len:207 (-) Transcript_23129:2975-3595(-)
MLRPLRKTRHASEPCTQHSKQTLCLCVPRSGLPPLCCRAPERQCGLDSAHGSSPPSMRPQEVGRLGLPSRPLAIEARWPSGLPGRLAGVLSRRRALLQGPGALARQPSLARACGARSARAISIGARQCRASARRTRISARSGADASAAGAPRRIESVTLPRQLRRGGPDKGAAQHEPRRWPGRALCRPKPADDPEHRFRPGAAQAS